MWVCVAVSGMALCMRVWFCGYIICLEAGFIMSQEMQLALRSFPIRR